MAITRWRPFRDLLRLQKEMDSMFDEFFKTPERRELEKFDWYPQVDVLDSENEIKISADLPGMNKDDIDVTVEDNVLTINGERKQEEETEEGRYYRSECCYGTFQRTFTLPNNVDTENVKAAFQNGVLELTLPKLEPEKGKKIEIETE